MVAVERPVELVGAQRPRICLIPKGSEHPKWAEVVGFIDALGVKLDEWQLLVLHASLLRRFSVWAAFAVAVCAPRQNGKNGILEIRELIGPTILGEPLAIHTAHLADTSKEAFRRLDDLLDANEWLSRDVKHIWRTNGHEAIEFRGGMRVRFRTRTRGGGRGFSGSPVFFDEAMFLPEISMGSILPVISAQPDPQVWYMGSPVDQSIHEDGLTFARVRERALRGEDDRLAYFEWSVDADSPDDLSAAVASDPESWALANPAFGIRIRGDYVAAEQRELDPRTFAVERLGVGDWPDPAGEQSVIPLALWRDLVDVESQPLDPLVFAFDVSPNRSQASIAVAGRRMDGRAHIELVEKGAGTGWIVERLAKLVASHRPREVVFEENSAAKTLVPELESAGVRARGLAIADYAAGCGGFFDAVDQAKVRHLGQPEVESAIRAAAQRAVGERWAWSRRSSAGDITPLVACTLGYWAAMSRPVYRTAGWS